MGALARACLVNGTLTVEEGAELTNIRAVLGRRARVAGARRDWSEQFAAMSVVRIADLVTAASTPALCDDGETDAAWRFQLAAARQADEQGHDRSRSWVPPILAPLVMAAMGSGLRRLFPFTSHSLLRFSRTADLGLSSSADTAPVFVAVVPAPDRYIVYTDADDAEPGHPLLETNDPAAAAAHAERLLAGWS